MTPTPRPKKKAKPRKTYPDEVKRHAVRLVLKRGCSTTSWPRSWRSSYPLTGQITALKLNAPPAPPIDPASPIRASAEKFFRGQPLADAMVFPGPSGVSRRKFYDYLTLARERLNIAFYTFANEALAIHLAVMKLRRPGLAIWVITDQGEARKSPKPLSILREANIDVLARGGGDWLMHDKLAVVDSKFFYVVLATTQGRV